MNFTLREMDVIRRVIELGSVTAAAAGLHISQPAITRILQHVEERLGFALFRRERKRLRPTPEALALFPELVRAFASMGVIERLVDDLRSGRSGILSIAAIPAFGDAVLPLALQRFRSERPDVSIVLQPESATAVSGLVAADRADLGVIIGPSTNPETIAQILCTTEVGCVLPRNHPATAAAELHPADLVNLPLICPGRHLPIGELVAGAFHEAGVPLRIAIEVPQATIACSMVRAGAGVAILDGFALLAVAHDEALAIRRFRPALPIMARLLRPRHRASSRLAMEFVETLDCAVRDLGLAPR